MKYRSFMAIALMFIGVMGCSIKEEAIEEVVNPRTEQDTEQIEGFKIVFEADPFVNGDLENTDTKTNVEPNGDYSNYAFKWSQKDTVGIYPDSGNQVFFMMTSGAGASTAEFDGGAWSCKQGHEYRSYFPFYGDIYLDATKIPVTFTGQKQVGNENSDHFQKYDYMYTPAVTKGTDNLTFSYHHLVTVIFPWVELPAGHYTGITLSLGQSLFVTEGKYDLTAASPAIVGTAFSNTLHVELDITFPSPDILKAYIPLAPIDMSGKTLTITVIDEDGRTYKFTKNPSMAYEAGKIYRLRAANSFVPEAVDLGLSVKWASFNLGASTPEEYGGIFAWGETGQKNSYSWSNYKWCNGTYNSLTKYNTNSDYGTVDHKTVLESVDDAAHVVLRGGWRMPTNAEWNELMNNCTWTWETVNGVNVRKVTSNITGYTDKWIYLPITGNAGSANYIINGEGDFWSSSYATNIIPGGRHATGVRVSTESPATATVYRYKGLPVRPVYGALVPLTGITLNQSSASIFLGTSLGLIATFTPANATEKEVFWSSSDTNIATVDSNGQVTTVAVGTATITVTTVDGGYTASCEVTVTPVIAVPETVDLGLSVKWASFNLGAAAPEEYGDYYAWGEIEPHYSSQNPLTWKEGKEGYNWASYKWCNGSSITFTKYNTESSRGTVDNKIVLEQADDAAHVNLGGNWRMPTDAEWTELRENCTSTWTTINGVNGRKVTSNKSGYTDKWIFLPGAGSWGGTNLQGAGSRGDYWSSTLYTGYPYNARYVTVRSAYLFQDYYDRQYGFSIRPVFGGAIVPVTGITLSQASATINAGSSLSLTATITPDDATDKTVTWSSSNSSIASVDASGTVTGVAGGSATITARAGTFTATCSVNVVVPVTSIRIYSSERGAEVSSLSMYPYDTDELSVVCYPTDATDKSLYETSSNYWTLSKTGYVLCTFGLISALEEGIGKSTVVTVHANGLSASCTISVLSPSPSPVDLGLSVNWADRNLYTQSSSGTGRFYTWAEASNYENGHDVALYATNGDWRLPTRAEIQELLDHCTATQATVNGVTGIRFTANNGNSIFLPDVGGYMGDTFYPASQMGVYYWSDTADGVTSCGYRLRWLTGDYSPSIVTGGGTEYKFAVRPVSTTVN